VRVPALLDILLDVEDVRAEERQRLVEDGARLALERCEDGRDVVEDRERVDCERSNASEEEERGSSAGETKAAHRGNGRRRQSWSSSR